MKINFKVAAPLILAAGAIALFLLNNPGRSHSQQMEASPDDLLETGIFISPGGSDAAACTRRDPCRTFERAVSLAEPGSVIHILEGRYRERFSISKSGVEEAPISIIGHDAVLPGLAVSGDHIHVSGVEVAGAVSHGILVSGKYVIVENSIVRHSVTENGEVACDGTVQWGSGLKVMVGGENIILRGNTVYENCGEGIAVTRGINVVVEDNIVRDNYVVNIYVDNSQHTIVRGNTVLCTGIYLANGRRQAGIAIAEEYYEGWGAQRRDNSILDNTVDGCHEGIVSWAPQVPDGIERNLLISGNTVTNGIHRSISLQWYNENVRIENNTVYAPVFVIHPDGVTLENNTVIELE